MNRLLSLRHRILSPLFNGYFANLQKVSVVGLFDTFDHHHHISNSNPFCFGIKRYFTSKSRSVLPKERRIPSKGCYNKSSLVLPSNREEEIQFLTEFRLSTNFVKSSTVTDLVKAAKSRKHSFGDLFCRKLCDILAEWLHSFEKLLPLVMLRVLHVHQYLNMPLNSQMNRTIAKWLQTDELNNMRYDLYISFISTLPYLSSLNLDNDQLTLLASAGKKLIDISELSNYHLVTFIWCWTNIDEGIKLSQLCPEVFQLWFHVTLARIPQLSIKECCQCFVALGKEGELPPLEWCKEMTKKMLTSTSFDEQLCSNLLMSIAKLPGLIQNHSDKKKLLNKLVTNYCGHAQKIGQIYPQSLCNISWALAKLHNSNIVDFVPSKKFWNIVLNTKFVRKFSDEGVLQMVNSTSDFGIQNVPTPFLQALFTDYKATKPSTAALTLYGIFNTNYRRKIPEPVIRDCFKVWYNGMTGLPVEQLTFPRYALNELYSDFKLTPSDIIPNFGPHFWKEITQRLDQNEVEREKNIFYLIKPHLTFNDVPIKLLNRMLKLTKITNGSALSAANILWLYGRLSDYKEIHIQKDLLRHNFKVWFAGLDSLSEGHAVKGLWSFHCHNISPETVIPNFWSLYWEKMENKLLIPESRTMLTSSVKKFANEIPEDLVEKYMNKY